MVNSLEGKHPQYYEAILQLRDCNKEIVDFVKQKLETQELRIPKFKKLKTGIDFYVSDKTFIRNLGKELKNKFGGYWLPTATLWGEKNGKRVYRLTVLFRSLPFKKGDIVEYKGEKYNLTAMLDNEILLQHNKTGKKVHVKYKDSNKIKI